MRVLAGGPARETESAMFRLHVEGLLAQAGDGLEIVVRHIVVPDEREYMLGDKYWHHDKFLSVAAARQQMLVDAVREIETDEVLLMVDTDVILGPGVLARLLKADADVVYGVFWTEANWLGAGTQYCPQVWDTHPYAFTDPALERDLMRTRHTGDIREFEVAGGGACTLIRGRGFESHYSPLLPGLRRIPSMMAGEDRTYCIGLEARGIRQLAVTGLPIHHCYTPELRTPRALDQTRTLVGL